jgi:hypothetical protein
MANGQSQIDDDFSYVMSYAGEKNLVIGTDYGHGDSSSELHAVLPPSKRSRVEPRVNGTFFPTI